MLAQNNSSSAALEYSLQLPFEADFQRQHERAFSWVQDVWAATLWLSLLYVLLVFGGRRYMKTREAFELRPALALWSGVLAVFSIVGAARTIPETVLAVRQHGFTYSVCSPSYFSHGVVGFWTYAFVLSKVYELGDTAFIVLRKQPLIFLHWYHHVTVLIYVWYSVGAQTAPGRWFMTVNYSVHALMYTYYCLRALRVRVPRAVNMCITLVQLLQMVVGLAINMYAWRARAQGAPCRQTDANLVWSLLMYLSYLVLFAHFFHNTYLAPKVKVKSS